MPEAAQVNSEAGARAFTEFFFAQVNRAWTAPDADALDALSDSGCQFCKKIDTKAEELASDGHHYAAPPVKVADLRRIDSPQGEVYFDIELTQAAVDVVDGAGRVVSSDQAKKGRFNVGVRWTSGAWSFLDMEDQG